MSNDISEFLVEGTCDNLYHFGYDEATHGQDYITAEEFFDRCAKYLRKHDEFIRTQRAELAIVAIDHRQRWNLLNSVPDWVADEILNHADELGKLDRIRRKSIAKIRIYNMLLPFDAALVLEARVTPMERKYMLLDIQKACFNTQEMGELINQMLEHRLIRIGDHKDLRWLHRKYHD